MRGLVFVAIVACTPGMRPALETAGPEIAQELLPVLGRPPEVYSLGDGCYIARRHDVMTCSIDVLPAGELLCAHEPKEDQFATADEGSFDPNLESFVATLNTRPCRQRWYDSFVVPPATVTITDVKARGYDMSWAMPLDELDVLGVPATIQLGRDDIKTVCLRDMIEDHWSVTLCFDANGRRVLREHYGFNPLRASSLSPAVEQAIFDRSTPATGADHVRCAAIEVSVSNIHCTSVRPASKATRRPPARNAY